MNPIPIIQKLQKRLEELAKPLGLDISQTVLNPGEDSNDPAILTVYFRVRPEAVQGEEDKLDAMFESIVSEIDLTPTNNKVEEHKAQILKDLKNEKGILGD